MVQETKRSLLLERYFKGVANHRRIDILLLLARRKDLSLQDIADELGCNFKTISEHTRRLVQAGLAVKKYRGATVEHNLSLQGRKIIQLMKSFSNS